MTLKDVLILFTMDCEPALTDVTSYASRMSGSCPPNYEVSENSIRGYVTTIKAYGFPATLFVHPEVAVRQRKLLLELQSQGVCLGLHLHPYKFRGGRYKKDLGAYSASKQHEIIKEAMDIWEKSLGQKPLYFRPGYFSANDNTFRVLQELGFKGGGVSCPGRILPEHYSVWSGAEPYPHRAHLNFRQLKGDSDFVEVPISVDYKRPILRGHARQRGYEWLYIPSSQYNHGEVIKDLLERFRADNPRYPVIVTDTHNNEDYSNPKHPARLNLDFILDSIRSLCAERGVRPVGVSLSDICGMFSR